MIRIGVIGYGYWGPNIVRNFHSTEGARVVAVSDKNTAVLTRLCREYPDIRITEDTYSVLSATDIDAIAIVTPVSTHYELARKALENGKHVLWKTFHLQ